MDQTAAEAELLAHAAREFLREPIRERREPGAFQQFRDFLVALEARAAKQAAEELYVLAHAQVGVEVLAETLRHVGDARTDSGAMRGVRHVAPEDEHASGLDLARAGDEAEQRRLSNAIGPDEADHAARRNLDRDVFQRDRAAINLRNALDPRDRALALHHLGTLPCSLSGQATVGSYLT